FPLTIGVIAGNIGQRVESAAVAPQIGVAMPAGDVERMLAARETLAEQLGPGIPQLVVLKRLTPGESYDGRAILERKERNLAAVLTGSAKAPELTVTPERLAYWTGPVALIAATASRTATTAFQP